MKTNNDDNMFKRYEMSNEEVKEVLQGVAGMFF